MGLFNRPSSLTSFTSSSRLIQAPFDSLHTTRQPYDQCWRHYFVTIVTVSREAKTKRANHRNRCGNSPRLLTRKSSFRMTSVATSNGPVASTPLIATSFYYSVQGQIRLGEFPLNSQLYVKSSYHHGPDWIFLHVSILSQLLL